MKKRYLFTGFLIALVPILYFLNATRDSTKPKSSAKENTEILPVLIPNDIDRMDIRKNRWENGGYQEETMTLKKNSDRSWQLTAPVTYPSNNALVHEMLTAIGKMKPIAVELPESADYREWQLDDSLGIDITIYIKSRIAAHLVIGASRNNSTYLKLANRKEIYQTPGLYRKVFDRSSSQLRSRVITDFDKGSVTKVLYHNREKPFTMVKTAVNGIKQFEPVGIEIQHFDSDRALVKAEALTALRARDFYDRSLYDKDHPQELEGALRVTVNAAQNGTPITVELTYGKEDQKTGLHYLTTSASTQVFLVSHHLEALFRAEPRDFERTLEQVMQQKIWKEKADAHAKEHERRREAFTQELSESDVR